MNNLGKKCFAFTKLDAEAVRGIRKAAFKTGHCCKYRKRACRDVKTVNP